MRWEWVGVTYFSYLAIVAFAGSSPARARWASATMAFGAWLWVWADACSGGWTSASPVAEVLQPACVLIVGYWVSGTFFVAPMPGVERFLLRLDQSGASRRILRWYGSSPRCVKEYFEVAYLLVYVLIPASAVTLAAGGFRGDLNRFWVGVLTAEFLCYGMLPWIQTRPPRAIEPAPDHDRTESMAGRLNRAILERGSIQANTIPSGHAAGAVAAALTVAASMPLAGSAYLALAASIVIATIVGRYHYALDSLLGVAVAIGAWLLATRWA